MKNKIYKITGVASLAIAAAVLLSMNKSYEPRMDSNLTLSEKKLSRKEQSIRGFVDEINALRLNQVTGDVSMDDYLKAVNGVKKAQLRRVAKDFDWEELGPDNVGGRTRAMLIDRINPNIMYVGCVSGGLWKSTTRGTSWKKINDDQDNLNVVSITQTTNGDIYYGIGEGAFVSVSGTKNGTPGFIGGGVYKSTDAGNTFTKLSSTNGIGWNDVSKLASDPTDSLRVYASNAAGFSVSKDGGLTWNEPAGQAGSSRDVQVSESGIIYSLIGSIIYKSSDKGETITRTTFNQLGQPSFNVGRLSLAISPQDENYVYALVSNNGGTFDGLARTTDGGATWAKLVTGGPSYAEFFGSNGQGDYDNIVTVDPTNKNRVFMAGVGMAEWDNVRGFNLIGSIFASRTNPFYVHADKHEMIWDRTVNPPVLWIGTDGGIFRSANMSDNSFRYIFAEQNRGYITTQFYGVAANAAGAVLGGTQDNGTQFINGMGNTKRSAVRIFGGDGFQAEIATTNSNIMFAESQYGNMQRSTNGGVSFAEIWDNRIGNSDLEVASGEPPYAPFDCQFRLWEDVENSSKSKFFFAPYGAIWAAINPLDKANRPNWFTISTNNGNQRVTCVEASKNGDNLFYCTANGDLFRVDSLSVATYDTSTLKSAIPAKISTVNIKGNMPGGRAITSISIDPSNPNRALVTLGNYGNSAYIYLSSNVLDASPTWTNVTNNLPAMPVYHGLILIDNPNYFVVATEMGIWATDNNGATWELQDNGMPANVSSYIIRQYEFKPWQGPVVYVGSHGRGFFRSNSFLTSVKGPKTIAKIESLSLFPNPAISNVNVAFNALDNGNVTYIVYNLQGKQVMKLVDEVDAGKVTKNIPLTGLSKGTYIINVKANGVSQSAKVIVQ